MGSNGTVLDSQHQQDAASAPNMSLLPRQVHGVEVLIVISVFSLVAVVTLLLIMIYSAMKALRTKSGFFVRSHVAAYFVSLLFADLLQAIGSIMNTKWVRKMSVDLNGFCTAQGAIKQAADVGTAVWVLVIAIHTFNVLFVGLQVRRYVMYIALIGGWCFVAAVVSAGPLALQTIEKGPYFGLSGYWCWISDGYGVERIVLEYMLMYMSAVLSFILYSLVFLRLRGNIVFLPGRRIQFRSVNKLDAWAIHTGQGTTKVQAHVISVAKHMLLYPVAYTILILPIGAVRFAEWTGHDVTLGPVIFSDCVFLLSGLVNATLFVTTRRVVPCLDILSFFKRKSEEKSCIQRRPSLASTMVGSVISDEDCKTLDDHTSNTEEKPLTRIASRLAYVRRDSDTPSETSAFAIHSKRVSLDASESVTIPPLSVHVDDVSHTLANFEWPSKNASIRSEASSPKPLPPVPPPPPPPLMIYTLVSSSPVWPGLHSHGSERDDVPHTARPFSYYV